MTLQLNGPQDYLKIDGVEIPKYREFFGSNLEIMPLLMAAGRVPMNVSQLMQARLNFRNGPQGVKTAWMDYYFDLGDAIIYHPNGDVKVVLDCQTLRQMTPQSPLRNSALLLTDDVYEALQGEVFKKGKLGKTETALTREEAKANPVWKALARDNSLLADYVDFIFAEGKQRFNYDNAMGVYIGSCSGDAPEMRLFCVDGLEGYRSFFDGRNDVDNGNGRLVGVAPEAFNSLYSGNRLSRLDLEKKVALIKKVNDLRDYIASLPDP